MCEASCLKSKFQTGLETARWVTAVQHEDLSLDMLNPSKKSGVAAFFYNPRAGESGEEMADPRSSLASHSSRKDELQAGSETLP